MKASNLKFVVMTSFLGLAMAACSPMSDNSLLSDKKDDNSSLTVDKTPKAEELYLKLDTASIGPAVTGTKLEVSGECYTSTYGKHRIIARENGFQLVITDVTAASVVANEAQCRNGRFNFSLNVSGMGAGGHSVRVSLEAYDGLSALVLNENQGAAVLNFTR
ncbi:hypothetical protein AZI86_14155 [Bdellovibrio bacteriovorus]|uniref:Lipoprotein n=1 Tax=Bdellovibrio bacteriovorus TaxID=959 RepID=A0A150WJL4_BDEBC|nr:hypothetical protein [Bdellovibrio bacteriovorus]KYG63949.1 hypothetical protein AZI86_14155 [Bdellovibrio bacteriovorus]